MQDGLVLKFPWLGCDPARGRHCSVCVLQPRGLRANDKLSIGYGNDAEGNPCPVPSEQKCTAHELKMEHRNAVRNSEVCSHALCLPAPCVLVHFVRVPSTPRFVR